MDRNTCLSQDATHASTRTSMNSRIYHLRRERKRKKEKKRGRQTDRQTDRQTGRQAGRQTDRHASEQRDERRREERERERRGGGITGKETERTQINEKWEGERDRQTETEKCERET